MHTFMSNDALEKFLGLIDDNKQSMNDKCYVELMNELKRIHETQNGSFTTNYRQMYFDAIEEMERVKEKLENTQLENYVIESELYPTEILIEKNEHALDAHIKMWKKDGVLHRDNLPAKVVQYFEGDTPYRVAKYWYQNGKLHRNGAPAIVVYYFYPHHQLDYVEWYQNGVHVRKGGPFYTAWDVDGHKLHERWNEPHGHVRALNHASDYYVNGAVADVRFDYPGSVTQEVWFTDDTCKTIGRAGINNPAVIYYGDYDGPRVLLCKEWYVNGLLHRENGPAQITYKHGTTKVNTMRWWKNGEVGYKPSKHIAN